MPAPRSAAHSAARRATVSAVLLVLIGSVGVQVSSAVALGLFDRIGVFGTSGVRLAIAAVILVIIFRPALRGRSRADWIGIVLYGVAMAAMNLLLYLAIDRVPIGVATTLDFLGPCVVALCASRRLREGGLALLALAGVGLIAGFGGPFDGLGLIFAALGGAAFGLYTLLAARVGKSVGGLSDMTLSVVVAAALLLPFSIPAVPAAEPRDWGLLVSSALLGVALAFVVDTMAGRLTSARVIGVLFAFDPVVGTIIGALWLGQSLTLTAVIGIALVVIAGAGIVWSAGQRKLADVTDSSVSGATETFEIERKYDVADAAEMPPAARFAELGYELAEPARVELEACYFDTADGELAAAKLAMRRRSGGADEGWHVKARSAAGVRELQWSLDDEMPAALILEVRRVIGRQVTAEELMPIATLRTVRRTVSVCDATQTAVIELADDAVDATNHRTAARARWREWEAELIPGADPSALEIIEPVLVAAGARPAVGTSKIQRTMSLRSEAPPATKA